MIYSSRFRDINENQYYVTIETATGNQTVEFTPGGTPFKVSMKGSESNLYKPVRYSGAECVMVTSGAPFDIYASGAHDTKVTLKGQSNQVLWIGYATPCMYSQGWDTDLEELEIEAIDGLSTLEYYKYYAPTRTIITFKELICKLLNVANCYTAFYFPAELKISAGSTARILDKLVISEQNFFEQKDNDEKKNDEDVAWTCKKVLEELCKFLNVSCQAIGDEVWFLDYDSIKAGHPTYHKYSVSGTWLSTVEHSFPVTINANSYSQTGTSLSLLEVYNKVTVSDDAVKFDSALPNPFDFTDNITSDSDEALLRYDVSAGGVGEVIQSNTGNLEALIDRAYSPDDHKYVEKNNFIGVQYCDSSMCTLYKYNASWNQMTYPSSICYTDTQNFRGALLAKMDVSEMELYQLSTWEQIYEWYYNNRATYQESLDRVLRQDGKSKISLSDYIIMLDPDASPSLTDSQLAQKPFIKFNVTDTVSMFGGNKAALVIQGSYSFHEFPIDPYPIPESQVDLKDGRKKLTREDCYLLCRMKWGSLYWNGDRWTTTVSNFKLNWLVGKEKNLRADNLMFKFHKFPSTVEWRAGISEEGYYIPAPDNSVLQGSPEFTIFRIKSPRYEDNKHTHKCVFIKDFKIKAVIGDPTFSGVNKTKTAYTNVINQRYVVDFDEIKFKICTHDDKNPSYSSVGYLDGDLSFLNKTYHAALAAGEATWNSSVAGSGMRQEEHLIYRISNQYATPTVSLKTHLKSALCKPAGLYATLDKQFVIDSYSIDYKMQTSEIKLIEKK